jgi:hypothetical protein
MAVGGGAVVAVPAAVAGSSSASVAAVPDQATADRLFVEWLSKSDPRPNLKVAARVALFAHKDVRDATIATFLASGYDYSKRRAAESRARNTNFAKRVLATHTAAYAPTVRAAAQHALDGTDSDRDRFVRTGYEQAKKADRQARQADNEHAAAILELDQVLVARLRDKDPGEQVRAAAAFALRDGATNSEVVEFFAFDWPTAAALDSEVFRTRCADNDILWRAAMRRLTADALAAEVAAREAADEAKAQKRAAAARAWTLVREQTAPARTAWADADEVAEAQAANWQEIARVAGSSTNPHWQAIAETAPASAEQWAAERANAAEQAAYWTALYEQALAAERALQP